MAHVARAERQKADSARKGNKAMAISQKKNWQRGNRTPNCLWSRRKKAFLGIRNMRSGNSLPNSNMYSIHNFTCPNVDMLLYMI